MPRELDPKLVDQAVLTIRMLAVDAIEKANSGHPGAPMGLASVGFEIFMRHLRYDPADPSWPGRDRFVLSCGHASMLQYALLHLAGYDLSLADLEQFRQWGSKTPGHPEVLRTDGVETTTGPLGQGIANAVGMAAAIKMMHARFAEHAPELCTQRVFAIASDGDLMEGLSSEAGSLAGHLGLDNLIAFHDDNRISIDGPTELTFTEDVGKRFEAFGWYVQRVDGHDHAELRRALDQAVAEADRPSLIMARTTIGAGAPNKGDTENCHGAPLGPEETKATKENLGWPLEPTFHVPEAVYQLFAERARDGAAAREAWEAKRSAFFEGGGETVALYQQLMKRQVPADLFAQLLEAAPQDTKAATRAHAGVIQQRVAELVPSLMGGSADLTPSNKTYIKGSEALAKGRFGGRNIHFGVREHAMGAFANGVALVDGFIPFTASFLMFCDYMRPAMRMAGLMRLPCVFVFSHDSVFVGEDGPTHQPVEQYWGLRIIPNLDVVRPADALECAAAWTHALERQDGPTTLLLTRQKLPPITRPAGFDPKLMLRGAYVLAEAEGTPDAVVIATGSEVWLALEARQILAAEGKQLRVVSAPCWHEFQRQDQDYRDDVLLAGIPRAFVELGITGPWRGVVGEDGLTIGHDDFGVSAPNTVLADKLGFTPTGIADRLRAWLAERS